MAFTDHTHIAPRTRRLVAGSVGGFIALLAFLKILLPTLAVLPLFPQFSPLMRAALLAKVLSPLLSFFLAAGWVWMLLSAAEWLLSFWDTESEGHRLPSPQQHIHPIQMPPERSTIAPAFVRQEASPASLVRPKTVPSLLQADPPIFWQEAHLPVTPLPSLNPAWHAPGTPEEREEDEQQQEESGSDAENGTQMPEEAVSVHVRDPVPPAVDVQNDETPPLQGKTGETLSFLHPGEPTETLKPVTLTLLKHVRVTIRADDGTTMEVKLRGGENAIRLLLLAYIAWRKGDPVDRDKMLTYVVARGKRRDMTTEQLGEVFDAAKRYLRQDLDRAIATLKQQGQEISQEIDFFASEPGFYRLHPSCQVADLERIEAQYHPIQIARKEGILDEKRDGSLPIWVVDACQTLIDAYPGDFLQSLLERFPDEFGSWVREPVTLYRDYYLDALLILANYESACGRNGFENPLSSEQDEEQRRRHSARAAQLFYDYAMYALKSRWDRKLKFAYRADKDGERVLRAERAIRRCVVELGKLSQPDAIDQVYLAFKDRMATLSEGTWKPDHATEHDVLEARKTTSAYRFPSQIVPHHDDLIKQEQTQKE